MIAVVLFAAVTVGTLLAWRPRLQRRLVDYAIRHGLLRGLTGTEVAYQKGLLDNEKLIAAERTSREFVEKREDRTQVAFKAAMQEVAACRKAADARKVARAWLKSNLVTESGADQVR